MALCDKKMESGFLNSSGNFPYAEKSAFTQTEHNIVAAYLITAGKLFVCLFVYFVNLIIVIKLQLANRFKSLHFHIR